jgi:SAM-dependent methyltransferase
VDLPRIWHIREGAHRIHNPIDARKLADLGEALRLRPGMRMLDLASGSGEMLCSWARDHGIAGTGVDISTVFTANAKARAAELGVGDQVEFIHGDAAGYVAAEPVDVAACIGATGVIGGTTGAVELLRRSLRPGGIILIGEVFWRRVPANQDVLDAMQIGSENDLATLPELIESFSSLGCDLVEMVLADKDSWDRYIAPHWRNIRLWLDENPDDELADEMRAELETNPINYVRYEREYLGWGVFALMNR